jgi:5-methylcytosine-specific restriction protein A
MKVRRESPREPSPESPEQKSEKAERDAFYSGKTWRRLRTWKLSINPICERHLKYGRYVPATHVHHKVERLADPSRSLDPTNLESLCASCHTRHHKGKRH